MRGVCVKKNPFQNTSTNAPYTYINLSPIIYEHGNCKKNINKTFKTKIINNYRRSP